MVVALRELYRSFLPLDRNSQLLHRAQEVTFPIGNAHPNQNMQGGTGLDQIPAFLLPVSFDSANYAFGARNRIFIQGVDLASNKETPLLNLSLSNYFKTKTSS